MLSSISEVSWCTATWVFGSKIRSVTVSASWFSSTATLHPHAIVTDMGGEQPLDLGLQALLALGLQTLGGSDAVLLLRTENDAGGGVDHRDLLGSQTLDAERHEMTDRLRLAAAERRAVLGRHGDRCRRLDGCSAEWLARARHQVHACVLDVAEPADRTGEFALFRAPVCGVEHVGRGAEPAELVEQLVAGLTPPRQSHLGERHADPIALD